MNYIEPPISTIKIKDEDEYKKGPQTPAIFI